VQQAELPATDQVFDIQPDATQLLGLAVPRSLIAVAELRGICRLLADIVAKVFLHC